MAPKLTLWMTFSQVSAPAGILVMSADWSERPPVFNLSLWQARQYLSTKARSLVTDARVSDCCGGGADRMQSEDKRAQLARHTMSFAFKGSLPPRGSGM